VLMSVHLRDLDTQGYGCPLIVLRPTICPAALIPFASASSHPHPAGISEFRSLTFPPLYTNA
jgi:hypothetical protein